MERWRFGVTFLNIPFVQPGEFILSVLVPFTPPLEVILVMQPATDCAPPWQMFTDILPFHAILAKLDDFGILIWRPFRLSFGGRLSGEFLTRRQSLGRHHRASRGWHGSHAGGYAG